MPLPESPAEAQQRLRPHLQPGEVLLWAGRPGQGLRFRPGDAQLIPFSIVWCGFSIFWTVAVYLAEAPWFFILWGLMFVAIGVLLGVGRFAFDIRQRARRTYGITSERVLVLDETAQGPRLDAHWLTDFGAVAHRLSRGGREGTIRLGRLPGPHGGGPQPTLAEAMAVRRAGSTPRLTQPMEVALEFIPDAEAVARLLRTARAEADRRAEKNNEQ